MALYVSCVSQEQLCSRAESAAVQIVCPHCQQLIEHADAPPKFCSHCGQPLTTSRTELADAETLIEATQPAAAGPAATDLSALGPYRLGRELGRGGMGVVYEAEHAETGRRLALKLLSPNIPRNSETTERFLREGRLAAALSHPRSTFVYEAGETAGQFYIAMELVPGRTLARVVEEEGPLPVHRAVDYVLDVIEGLSAAHDRDVIHRDVKPSNCFLSDANRVKVGDFGLSKSLVTDASLTRTGTFLGTPQYAAPEQVRGGSVDPRTDVYAVGATLFYLLTGRGPFTGDAAAVIAQIASDAPPRLRDLRDDVPEELDRIVARSLAKEPEARYATMADLGNALRPYATGGVSIGDVGRRLAAYFLDNMLVGFGMTLIIVPIVFALMLSGELSLYDMHLYQVAGSAAGVFAIMIYFAICEGRWGCGIGKRLMGLRVVNLQGDAPGFRRALLRALMLPGVTSLPGVFLPLVYKQATGLYGQGYLPWLGSLCGWGMTLLFLSTMRARNGYRGIHEFTSGTRVVGPRSAPAAQLANSPIVTPVETPESGSTIGTFQITGKLGVSGSATILQGEDSSLRRRAWVFVATASDEGPTRERAAVTRPARPFWLTGGRVDGRRWDAFEAVRGAPLTVAVKRERAAGSLLWEQGRLLLLQLSEELAAAAEDGTLPERSCLDQIWVEPGGRIKLLDAPLRTSADAPVGETTTGPVGDAVRVLRQVADVCSGDEARAVHVQEFIDELRRRPEDASTLTWAAHSLRDLSHQRSALRWDDRLGILAATSGTELPLYIASGFLIASGCALITSLSIPSRAALAMVLSFILPAVLGFWLRGGPVFRLTGTQVRYENRPASRLRCGWRSLLAWGLNMQAWSLLGILQTAEAGQALDTTGQFSANNPESLFYLAASVGWSLPYLAFTVGALCTLIRPSRGIQDYIAGTSLVPR